MNETLAKQKVTPKKMNATNARGLNAVKQRIKKTIKEYQSQVDDFRKDSEAFMESSDEEEPLPLPKPTKLKLQDSAGPEAGEEDEKGFSIVDKKGKAIPFSPESIQKHLRAIIESRGRKNTDRNEQIRIMEELNRVAETPYLKIRVLQTLISARFDLGSGSNAMPLEHWKAAEKELGALLTLLETHRDHIVVETAEEWEDDEKVPVLGPGDKHITVPGSVVSYIERLDDELTRSLQNIDPHTPEYIDRLTDETSIYNAILRGLLYYETIKKDSSLDVPQESLNRIVQRRLDHIYFKVCVRFSFGRLCEHSVNEN
jgi:translation initiation factor 3 subunit C